MDFKFPRYANGKSWILDYDSSYHSVLPKDALMVSKMNVHYGGKQPVMGNGTTANLPEFRKDSKGNAAGSAGKRSNTPAMKAEQM